MSKKRVFTTLPTSMMQDETLTALDIRCAMAIAMRDGMSHHKGKGAGCYARFQTLADDVGTDVTNFTKCLKRLQERGYVLRERQEADRRRSTLRIVYEQKLGEPTNHLPEQLGEPANHQGEKLGQPTNKQLGDADSENGGSLRVSEGHYNYPKGLLDSLKGKLNSSEEAHFSGPQIGETLGLDSSTAEKELEPAEAGLSGVSIWEHLPANVETLNLGAQVAKIESAYDKIGKDADSIIPQERQNVAAWLQDIADQCLGGEMDSVGQQANRLWEELAVW